VLKERAEMISRRKSSFKKQS